MKREEEIRAQITKKANRLLYGSLLAVTFVVLVMVYSLSNLKEVSPDQQAELDAEPVDRMLVENGTHVMTGLKEAEGMFLVVNNCTNCHSAKLVTQNRMTAERWNETIAWMQETQGLWDLGESQELIVNYLVTNYPPSQSNGRRANLTNIEWYEAEE